MHISKLTHEIAYLRRIQFGKKSEQLAGERAAAVMTLIQSAKLNGHDPYAYMKDMLTRLPTWLNSRIQELLPHNWQPETTE